MDSQKDQSQFSFSPRIRNDNNDPETVKYLRDLIIQKYGPKYLRQFINNHPYHKEKENVVEKNTKKNTARHFTSIPNSNSIRIPEYKKVNNAVIGSIFNVCKYENLPDIDEVCAFKVVFGLHKPTKKHKQWTDDGFILIENKNLTIYDETGKILSGPRPVPFNRYIEGEQFIVGSNEYEISTRMNVDDIKSGNFTNPRLY